MKKVFSKLLASIITVVMLAVSVGAMSASAITPAIVPGSKFNYEVTVEKVSGYSYRYKLSVNVTNNPGVKVICFGVEYDKNCRPIESLNTHTPGLVIGSGETVSTVTMINGSEYNGAIGFELYFTVTGSAATNHEFSVGVYRFLSDTVDAGSGVVTTGDAAFGIRDGMVGDLDANNSIDVDDAYLEKVLLNKLNKVSITVDALNAYLKDDENRETLISQGQFLGLINNTYVSAAVADTDGNNKVDLEDSNEILTYYTHASVGSSYENAYIGRVPSVKIVY